MGNRKSGNLPILIIDDEELWLHSISLTLERYGGIRDIIKCRNSLQAMDILAHHRVGLILLDLIMPDLSGERLLSMIVESYPEIPVIVITGMNQVETGIKCMKLGAFDFFVKTVGKDELIASVQRALRLLEMRTVNESLSDRLLSDSTRQPEAFSEIITQDRRMKSIFRYIEAVGQSSQPLLIEGESGTGKEMVARAAHHVSRPEEPFICVNAAGLDDNVFADTLFGHVKGAFTGAEQNRPGLIRKAGRGIVFLDEISDLSLTSQTKLLRILQEGEFLPLGLDESETTRARFFFATNKNLERQMGSGQFRKDLYYRVRAHHVHLPALRERPGDIPLLVNHFIERAADSMEKNPPAWRDELISILEDYDFPGNIRELRSLVYDAVSQGDDAGLCLEAVTRTVGNRFEPRAVAPDQGNSSYAGQVSFPGKLPTLRQINRLLIEEAMQRADGNQTVAAGMIGISQPSLSRRLKLLNESKK